VPCSLLSCIACSTVGMHTYIKATSCMYAHRGTGCRQAWQMPRCGTGQVVASLADTQPNTKVARSLIHVLRPAS
jgi:hypothetical protein